MARLNHIGIAVNQLPELKKLFSILGFSVEHEEVVPTEKVKTHFLPLPKEVVYLEFLEPTSPESTIAQFMAKKGPGIHHLSFELEKGKLESTCAELKKAGYQLIYDSPRPGAHSMRINFIHPKTAGGMLIELMEPQ